MKLATNSVPITTNLQSQAFQVGDPSMLFNILADKIYTDKIRAVVREICCNALDAHRGIDQPFFVSLPTQLDPTFSVRDFGSALSEEDVLGLYTTFFSSTKRDDDGQIGGFGLGSKSPFAYTDAFTVVSIQDGVKKTYAAFRDGNRVPQITLTSTNRTDEPQGLEVKVPVLRSDFYAFRDRAWDILRWFPKGSVTLFGADLEHVTPTMDHGTWMTIPDSTYNYVLMGPVTYLIDWRQAGVDIAVPTSIVPVFQIGELELPPSRENLSYDPVSVARLKARFDEIAREFPAETLKSAESMGPVEKLNLVNKITGSNLSGMFNAYHVAMGHREADIQARRRDPSHKSVWGTVLRAKEERIEIQDISALHYSWEYRRRGSGHRLSNPTHLTVTSYVKEPTNYFVLHDLQNERAPRIRDRLSELESGVLLVTKGWDNIRQALSDLPDSRFLKLSEIEPPYRERKKAQPRQSALHHRKSPKSRNFYSCFESLPDGGVYVPFSGHTMDPAFEPLLEIPWVHHERIFGLTKSTKLGPNWVRLDHWVEAKAKAALADPNLGIAIAAQAALSAASGELLPLIKDRAATGLFDILPAATRAWADVTDDAALLDEMAVKSLTKLGHKIKMPKERHNLIKKIEQAHKRNPVLILMFQLQDRKAYIQTTSQQLEGIAR